MEKNMSRHLIPRLLVGILLALELCFIVDVVITLLWRPVPALVFIAAAAAVMFLLLLCRLSAKRMLVIFLVVAFLCVLLAAAAAFIWYRFYNSSDYRDVDDGKSAMYAGKKVMVIVPHQDDELNIAGGVIEEFVKYGSEVYPVFVTTGENRDLGRIRMAEALTVMAHCGVDGENVIFLGYGNDWGKTNIYNTEPDKILTSHEGYSATYGLPDHPAYRDGHPFSRQNLLDDMRSVILEYRPDMIFCNDYDYHSNHCMVSFVFEEAMGEILHSVSDYTPAVFKGMAYSTAYDAVDDYYALNIRATAAPYKVPYLYERPDYQWDARIRFPVSPSVLSRSLLSSELFSALRLYKTQTAWLHAPLVINGDKVFWFRPTTSLSYRAEVSTSSGDASLLNNFKLLDSSDIEDFGRMPYEDTWVTAPGDSERSAELRFPAPVSLSHIRLYDDPDAFDNVLNAEIVFDDGSRIETGPLEYQGAPTSFDFEPKTVSSFTVRILESEGEGAGITEIEAYSAAPDTGLRYIKLMNASGDFVYDYRIDRGGQEEFELYVSGAPELSGVEYTVSCEGDGCTAEIRNGRLEVVCPRGKDCVVCVSSADGELSDSVYFSNPSPLKDLGQVIEDFAWHNYFTLQDCSAYRLLRFAYHLVGGETVVL